MEFDPSFPPLLTGHPVLPPLDPFKAARTAALAGSAGAGDLFWSCSTETVSFAVVLEPEVSTDRSVEMLFVVMVAVADAIGALGPPELAITWRWPDQIRANKARIGRARMARSVTVDEDGAPDWLVIGVDLALMPQAGRVEPGHELDITTLWDEGGGDIEAMPALESLSRHFLTWIHKWDSEGFRPVHDAWLFRADNYRDEITVEAGGRELTGTFIGLDEAGNLLLKSGEGDDGRVVPLSLAEHMQPEEADMATGGAV